MVSGGEQVHLLVEAADDEDDGDLAELTLLLRAELLTLDVVSVDPVPLQPPFPGGAKGLVTAAGNLLVWLGPDGLGVVLAKIADWVSRNGRTVEVTIDGKSLKLGRASREQQDHLVEEFVARLDPRP